jgi:hypothetical protein
LMWSQKDGTWGYNIIFKKHMRSDSNQISKIGFLV